MCGPPAHERKVGSGRRQRALHNVNMCQPASLSPAGSTPEVRPQGELQLSGTQEEGAPSALKPMPEPCTVEFDPVTGRELVSWEVDRPIPAHVWRIHGRDYDMTTFVDDHPGGAHMILLGKGTECTNLFESYHVINEPRKRLQKYDVSPDGLQPVVPECPSAYMRDIRDMVREHFKQERGKPNDGHHKASTAAICTYVLLWLIEIGLGIW